MDTTFALAHRATTWRRYLCPRDGRRHSRAACPEGQPACTSGTTGGGIQVTLGSLRPRLAQRLRQLPKCMHSTTVNRSSRSRRTRVRASSRRKRGASRDYNGIEYRGPTVGSRYRDVLPSAGSRPLLTMISPAVAAHAFASGDPARVLRLPRSGMIRGAVTRPNIWLRMSRFSLASPDRERYINFNFFNVDLRCLSRSWALRSRIRRSFYGRTYGAGSVLGMPLSGEDDVRHPAEWVAPSSPRVVLRICGRIRKGTMGIGGGAGHG
jgi:hypothetical protein